MTSDSFETKLGVLNALWEQHTEQDREQFEKLSGQMEVIDQKVTQILIREARRDGEIKGQRRTMIVLSGVVSLLVSVAGVAVAMNVF